jgi:hypothetical protein
MAAFQMPSDDLSDGDPDMCLQIQVRQGGHVIELATAMPAPLPPPAIEIVALLPTSVTFSQLPMFG